MTITLRPYQSDLIQACRVELRSHQSVLLQLPTGGGKTAIATQMLSNVAAKSKRGAFIVHRQELCDQTIKTFQRFNVPHGVISAGYTPFLMQPIQICSIDTLRSRLASGRQIPRFDMMLWDEAHHMAAASWGKVKDFFPHAKHIGLSATPERLDGKGLRKHFSAMVQGPTTAQLMDQGYLCRYRAFAPSHADLTGVHTKMGDYNKAEVDAAMQKASITGDMVTHYLRIARGKKFIARCINIERSKELAERFRAAGIMTWHVDGDTPHGERRQAMEAFRRGDLVGLTNVDLFGEGVDVADAEVFIDGSPTKSLAKCLQGWGRVLRPDGDKVATILDHANNIATHGLPDDEREWSLDGREARAKRADDAAAIPVRQCPRCYHCHRPAPRCPACGWSYELKARQVDQVDGDLAEIDLAAQRAAAREEQAKAATIEDLIRIGRERQYKSPERWASHVYTSRLAKRKRWPVS